MYINKALKAIKKTKPVLFTTTVHGQDFSEIEGLDNLQAPCGVIRDSLQKTAGIYGSKASFYLVNGSSSGIIALMLATVIKEGDKILISRNAHKSVINALILTGATPVWLETEWLSDWNIPGKTIFKDCPDDIKAVWITSPTYEGITTDIKPIAEYCRQRDILLIADEAHGALWNFSELLPESSIHLGADACVQSLHKTGSCLNQGALLHLSKDSRISPEQVQQALNIINTTSPSYIMLASIEASIDYLDKNRKVLNTLIKSIQDFKKDLPFVDFLDNDDPTKIFFGIKGKSGNDIADYLQDKYNLEVEMNNEKGLLAITGIATTPKMLKTLKQGIIAFCHPVLDTGSYKMPHQLGCSRLTGDGQAKPDPLPSARNPQVRHDNCPYITPQVALTPKQAFYSKSKQVTPQDAIGSISQETIVAYPPGIPLIIAGEIIQEAHIEYLSSRTMLPSTISITRSAF